MVGLWDLNVIVPINFVFFLTYETEFVPFLAVLEISVLTMD